MGFAVIGYLRSLCAGGLCDNDRRYGSKITLLIIFYLFSALGRISFHSILHLKFSHTLMEPLPRNFIITSSYISMPI